MAKNDNKGEVRSFEVVQLTEAEINKVGNSVLTKSQYELLLAKTPAKFLKTREGRGGETFTYVPGAYMRKMLNLLFGWDWSFTVKSYEIVGEEVIVEGRVEGRVKDKLISKEQFGSASIKYLKKWNDQLKRKEPLIVEGKKVPVSIGDDLKAAATDALKKCANLFGIADDVYAPEEFTDVVVTEEGQKFTAAHLAEINNCDTLDELGLYFETHPEFVNNKVFKSHFKARQAKLQKEGKV